MSYPFPEEIPIDPPIEEFVPRRTVEPDALARLMGEVRALRREIQATRNSATIAGGSLSGDAEPFTVYDNTDTPVVRIGKLSGGGYGIEVLKAGVWTDLRI
jgi:hypothetical protein